MTHENSDYLYVISRVPEPFWNLKYINIQMSRHVTWYLTPLSLEAFQCARQRGSHSNMWWSSIKLFYLSNYWSLSVDLNTFQMPSSWKRRGSSTCTYTINQCNRHPGSLFVSILILNIFIFFLFLLFFDIFLIFILEDRF